MRGDFVDRLRFSEGVTIYWGSLDHAEHAAQAVLSLGIELRPLVSRPGERLDLEITVSNTDGFSRTGVGIDLVVPAGVDDFNRVLLTGPFTWESCAQLGTSGVCTTEETISWLLGTLDPHQSFTVTLPPVVGALVDGATLTFSPVADDSNVSPIGVNDTTTVDSTRILELEIDEDFHRVANGGELVYLLHTTATLPISNQRRARPSDSRCPAEPAS